MTRFRSRRGVVVYVETSEATQGMLARACTYCGAVPGEWCTTAGGARATFLHSSRFYDWKDSLRGDDGPDR